MYICLHILIRKYHSYFALVAGYVGEDSFWKIIKLQTFLSIWPYTKFESKQSTYKYTYINQIVKMITTWIKDNRQNIVSALSVGAIDIRARDWPTDRIIMSLLHSLHYYWKPSMQNSNGTGFKFPSKRARGLLQIKILTQNTCLCPIRIIGNLVMLHPLNNCPNS